MKRQNSSRLGSRSPDTHSTVSNTKDDEIRFLKEKLLDTHSKLIEQLDITKDQHQEIQQLKQRNDSLQQELENTRQRKTKYNNRDVETLNEQLQVEYAQKMRLKDELTFLTKKYRELEAANKYILTHVRFKDEHARSTSLRKKTETLEQQNTKLAAQIQELQRENEIFKTKLISLEKQVKSERDINKALTDEKKSLEAKLFTAVLKNQSLTQENAELKSRSSSESREIYMGKITQVEKLKHQIQLLNQQLMDKEHELVQARANRTNKKPSATPRRNYDETKELIRRLEETEVMTRNKYNQKQQSRLRLNRQLFSDTQNKEITFDEVPERNNRYYDRRY